MIAATAADLAAVPFFSSLSAAELAQVAPLFAIRSYPKNAILATEGDRLDMFSVVLSGRLQFFWRDQIGRQVDLGIEGPGGHFAYATLGGEPILVSVIALEGVRLASIPIGEVKPLLLRYPNLGYAVLVEVVHRFRRILQAARNFTMEDVYARVVKLLLARAVETDGRLVTDRVTHADIGHRVGATREMVGRVLRELARGGYVKADRGRIVILRNLPKRR
jgi:CRP/FNR family cyclic AMP-dependent transcriptional regulator